MTISIILSRKRRIKTNKKNLIKMYFCVHICVLFFKAYCLLEVSFSLFYLFLCYFLNFVRQFNVDPTGFDGFFMNPLFQIDGGRTQNHPYLIRFIGSHLLIALKCTRYRYMTGTLFSNDSTIPLNPF